VRTQRRHHRHCHALSNFRAELAVCAILAASAALLYLAAHGFWTVMAISLLQAAALAPLVPLADALSLADARPQKNTAGFEFVHEPAIL
jgi:hypothetical protein